MAMATAGGQMGKVLYAAKRGMVVYNQTRQLEVGADVCITPNGTIRIVPAVVNRTSANTSHRISTN
jgi:hypothetical protein